MLDGGGAHYAQSAAEEGASLRTPAMGRPRLLASCALA